MCISIRWDLKIIIVIIIIKNNNKCDLTALAFNGIYWDLWGDLEQHESSRFWSSKVNLLNFKPPKKLSVTLKVRWEFVILKNIKAKTFLSNFLPKMIRSVIKFTFFFQFTCVRGPVRTWPVSLLSLILLWSILLSPVYLHCSLFFCPARNTQNVSHTGPLTTK